MDNTQYFYRTAIFTRKDNQVSLVDIEKPEDTTPMEDWMAIVVSLADGRHTVNELIAYMGSQYQSAPQELEDTLHSVLERLQEGKIVQLSDQAVELPYYLAEPLESLDIEKAKELIKEDGYIHH
ncbi:hypothetical protein [Shewanella atlantica]|uniref:PqqD family protein n=1 Tax=Shewanella atlantica TaxID=271099 RepID=A0A3S0KEE8_9GAMM|nr:hypothetical protein [Shewanella atlantica]RTR28937.1 hypothetical protein EKG39_18345 [Shewanella atlantica]